MVNLFDMLFEMDCLVMIVDRNLGYNLGIRIVVKFEDK
jgi:hypothetical protein